jgi:hypothetical protein
MAIVAIAPSCVHVSQGLHYQHWCSGAFAFGQFRDFIWRRTTCDNGPVSFLLLLIILTWHFFEKRKFLNVVFCLRAVAGFVVANHLSLPSAVLTAS